MAARMNLSPSRLNIQVVSTERLHASNRTKTVRHAPLSILDANVANFSPAQLIFLYSATSDQDNKLVIDNLKRSLQSLLALYPQWCGRLHFSDFKSGSTSHLDRYGRFVLTYGGEQEPGVEFVVARTDINLASIVPSPDGRADLKVWDATNFPRDELIPTKMLAPDPDNHDAPTVIAQVTEFGCGGLGIDLKMPHALADGTSYARFMHAWAALTRGESLASVPMPIFDPQRLDNSAEGNIDSDRADPAISQRARGLPCHRFDWWISAKGCLFPPASTQIPEALQNEEHDEPGNLIPWTELDVTLPMKVLVLHFTGAEIKALQLSARKLDRRASKQDALITHLWSCINRARGLSETDELVYLNYALGLRSRVNPLLNESFVGSPILLAFTSASGREACRPDCSSLLAARLRQTVSAFTPNAVAAYIHDRIYDQSPQRLWQTFIGKRHVLVTSLMHLKLPDLDFGFGRPRYVESVMPDFDGLLQLQEACSMQALGVHNDWSDAGVDCQLHLPVGTAARLLEDPILRRFAEQHRQSRL